MSKPNAREIMYELWARGVGWREASTLAARAVLCGWHLIPHDQCGDGDQARDHFTRTVG